MSDAIRIFMTGTCEGYDKLREALAQQPGLEVVGAPMADDARIEV